MSLSERVVSRYLKMAALKWTKTPLNSIRGDSGIYARSEPDGRFLITVRRWLTGQPGHRHYILFYSAVDYQTSSEGKHYSRIPVPHASGQDAYESVDVKKVFATVEKWAAEHPLPAEEPV